MGCWMDHLGPSGPIGAPCGWGDPRCQHPPPDTGGGGWACLGRAPGDGWAPPPLGWEEDRRPHGAPGWIGQGTDRPDPSGPRGTPTGKGSLGRRCPPRVGEGWAWAYLGHPQASGWLFQASHKCVGRLAASQTGVPVGGRVRHGPSSRDAHEGRPSHKCVGQLAASQTGVPVVGRVRHGPSSRVAHEGAPLAQMRGAVIGIPSGGAGGREGPARTLPLVMLTRGAPRTNAWGGERRPSGGCRWAGGVRFGPSLWQWRPSHRCVGQQDGPLVNRGGTAWALNRGGPRDACRGHPAGREPVGNRAMGQPVRAWWPEIRRVALVACSVQPVMRAHRARTRRQNSITSSLRRSSCLVSVRQHPLLALVSSPHQHAVSPKKGKENEVFCGAAREEYAPGPARAARCPQWPRASVVARNQEVCTVDAHAQIFADFAESGKVFAYKGHFGCGIPLTREWNGAMRIPIVK